PQLVAFSEILNQILNDSESNDQLLVPIQKLLLHSVTEYDIFLCGIDTRENENSNQVENIGLTMRFTLKKEYEQENIIYIWPQLSPVRKGSDWKEFCH
ncbi:10120_t:CDS:2, partial [Racocetra persica]